MKIDNNKKYPPIILSFIAIAVLVTMIALVSPVVISQQQLQQQTLAQQQTNATASNQSAAAASSANITAADGELGSVLKLSQANVALDIPLIKGYENGHEIFFIATDASDNKTAAMITNEIGFKVNFAPVLAQTPEASRGQAYVFTNGIAGQGPFGFQLPVVNAKPGDKGYSPLMQMNLVEWNQGVNAGELKSVQEIMNAQQNGSLTITKTDTIVNNPAIKWEGGSLKIREDKNINDDTPYMEGQVLNIDTNGMLVTFVSHRGWGPDGKTIYYIVTDATPEMPANMMGVPHVQADEIIATTPVAVDLLQFGKGIRGSGPMGFQSGIGVANPDDTNYSPLWRISFIEWKDPSKARILENIHDVAAMQKAGLITVVPAMGGKHVVNCPFFEPSTVFEHQSKSTS
jgi:type II secretory pathway pseudopilin PulG